MFYTVSQPFRNNQGCNLRWLYKYVSSYGSGEKLLCLTQSSTVKFNGLKRFFVVPTLLHAWKYIESETMIRTTRFQSSPVCTFSQPHTSWRRTVQWGRLFAPLWWGKRHRPWHQEAPSPSLRALRETRSRGSTRPDAEPGGNQREAAPGWLSSAHQAQGNPYPAPPTSPENKTHETRDMLLWCTILMLIKATAEIQW